MRLKCTGSKQLVPAIITIVSAGMGILIILLAFVLSTHHHLHYHSIDRGQWVACNLHGRIHPVVSIFVSLGRVVSMRCVEAS